METMHAAGRRRLPPVPRAAGSRPAGGQLTAERPAPEPIDTDLSQTQVIDTRQLDAELIEAELAALATPQVEDAVSTDDTEQFQLAEIAAQVAAAEAAEAAGAEQEAAEVAGAEQEAAEDLVGEPAEETAEEAAREPAEETAGEPAEEAAEEPAETPAEALLDEHDPAQQFVARLRSSAVDFAGAAGAESAVVREAVPPARHRRARCRLVLRYDDGDVADVTLLGPVGAPGRPSRHGFDRQILRWLGAGLVRDDAWLVDDPDAPDGVAVDLSAWTAAS